jgi:hypothetical protein
MLSLQEDACAKMKTQGCFDTEGFGCVFLAFIVLCYVHITLHMNDDLAKVLHRQNVMLSRDNRTKRID